MKSAILYGIHGYLGHEYKFTEKESAAIAGVMEQFLDFRNRKGDI